MGFRVWVFFPGFWGLGFRVSGVEGFWGSVRVWGLRLLGFKGCGLYCGLMSFRGDSGLEVLGVLAAPQVRGLHGSFRKLGGTLSWDPYNKDPTI